MAYGGFDLGTGLGSEFLSPAMGRVMAESPEALIPFFAEAGITPMEFAQYAQTSFNDRMTDESGRPYIPAAQSGGAGQTPSTAPGASNEFIPSSGDISRPEDDPYRQPAVTPGMKPGQVDPHLSLSEVLKRAENFYTPLVSKALQNAITYGSGGKDQSQAPTDTGPVSPFDSAAAPLPFAGASKGTSDYYTGDSTPPADSYTQGKPGVSGRSETARADEAGKVDEGDTKKGETDSEEAKAEKKKKAFSDALTGIKAPPAPPTPQLRPETGRAGAFPHTSPLITFLAGMLSGQMGGSAVPRLMQTVPGGK